MITTLVAVSFGKDKLTVVEIVASVLIFIGVYFVNKTKKPKLRTDSIDL
jgi:drug/metabolite transporter (DMT)-like permease